jgi:hypothetical protein
MVTNAAAEFDLALRLRQEGAALGDIFSFVSGLYFRGKSMPPPRLPPLRRAFRFLGDYCRARIAVAANPDSSATIK